MPKVFHNVPSPAALRLVGYMAAYSAAKACLRQFSQSSHDEWNASGVAVQTLWPAPIDTKLDGRGGPDANGLGVPPDVGVIDGEGFSLPIRFSPVPEPGADSGVTETGKS